MSRQRTSTDKYAILDLVGPAPPQRRASAISISSEHPRNTCLDVVAKLKQLGFPKKSTTICLLRKRVTLC